MMRFIGFGLLGIFGLGACRSDGSGSDGLADTEGTDTNETGADPSGSGDDAAPSTTATTGASTGDASTDGSSGSSTGGSSTGVDDCAASGAVFGQVYLDENGSDLSRYVGGFEDGIDTPLGDMEIRVFGAEPFSVQTCDDGSYQVPTLDDGVYVVSPVDLQAACSRRNCPRRLPVALEEGAVKILTIGDSVPVEGDPVTFPARVADLMAGLAEIDQVNAAVSGTQSSDWLPDGSYFGEIRSELADTDVVVIVLGGNDVLNYVSTADLSDLGAAVAGAQATVDQVVVNVRAIATEVRSENADIDVVFCIYPDYSQATATPPWSDLSFLPPGVVSGLLARARDAVTPEDAFVIVDLLEITQDLPQPLDDYLADSLHFNDAGHDLYAHEVFRALGGVIVGESPLGNGETFENRHDFGFVE